MTISEKSPMPIGMILETSPRTMIRVGETLDSMRVNIGAPHHRGTANEWGAQKGPTEFFCYEGGGVFKVRTALVFVDGKLVAIADWSA